MEFDGLNKEEVEQRKKDGKVNKIKRNEVKSYLKIIFNAFFNFYNLILYAVAILFIIYSVVKKDSIPISKYGFLIVVILNGIISLYTNIKAKRQLTKLNLINKSKFKVIRDGKEIEVDDTELVIDDIIKISTGDVIPCDIEILEGNLNVDESILTGESDLIAKKVGDTILGGSSAINGYIIGRIIKVGKDTYLNGIKSNLLKIKKKKTPLEKNLHTLILFMICLMIPACIAIFVKMLSVNSWSLTKDVVTKTATIIVGMIPIGMILLSSITLTNSVIKLLKQNVLTQNLYSIENLAKIDTLALDKTGTITTSNLKVDEVIVLDNSFSEETLLTYLSAFKETNKTSLTVISYLKEKNIEIKKSREISEILEFSSKNKYSSLKINKDKYYFGAIEFLSKNKETLSKAVSYQKEGKRVLLFKENDKDLAIIVLSDEISKGIEESISNFKKLGINIKVISGDNLETVKVIASKVGIDTSRAISLEGKSIEEVTNIATKYDIFARSTPEQKEAIIKELEKNKNKVCYIGDGINDLLSLKNATCSISFQNASSASKNVSDFILLDNDFNSLDKIVYEGRRVINNIERSSLLFLTKNMFFFLASITSIFFKQGMLIDIESIYIFEWIIIAFGGFLLSIENNIPKKEEENFIKRTLLKSFMSSLYLFLPVFIVSIINNFNQDLIGNSFGVSTLFITLGGLIIYLNIIIPGSKYSKICLLVVTILCGGLLVLLPSLFLESNYLASATTIKGQLDLLINGLFKFDIFRKFNINSYIYLIVVFIISSAIYLLINFYIKLKKRNK